MCQPISLEKAGKVGKASGVDKKLAELSRIPILASPRQLFIAPASFSSLSSFFRRDAERARPFLVKKLAKLEKLAGPIKSWRS